MKIVESIRSILMEYLPCVMETNGILPESGIYPWSY